MEFRNNLILNYNYFFIWIFRVRERSIDDEYGWICEEFIGIFCDNLIYFNFGIIKLDGFGYNFRI